MTNDEIKSLETARRAISEMRCQIRQMQNDIRRSEYEAVKLLANVKEYHCLKVDWSMVRNVTR